MGYNTKFSGVLSLSRALTIAEAKVILDANEDPSTIVGDHPGSYMQWVPTESLDSIVYDGNEKFYYYDKWMDWLLMHLESLGIKANGEIHWQGESVGDVGVLDVKHSILTVTQGNASKAGTGRPLTLSGLATIALELMTSQGKPELEEKEDQAWA